MKKISTDIIIIGAGPAGLFTAFEAGMVGYKCAIIDSLTEVGGQLSALYPEKPIYDIPGYPEIIAKDLVKNLEKQVSPFKPIYVLGEAVSSLQKEEELFYVKAGNTEINAKVVIVAAGGGVFTPRKPPVKGLEPFEGRSIFYAVKNKQQFAGKNIVIAGGGDSAVDWAVELAGIAKHISIVHRRPDFRAVEATVKKMKDLSKKGKISIYTPCQLLSVDGEGGRLKTVIIKDFDDNKIKLNTDKMLCFFGIKPDLGPIASWRLELSGKQVKVKPSTMETNIKGILAVGDITEYNGKLHLILTGFAEGAIAAKTAQSIIDPDKTFKLVYSTSKGLGK